MGTLFVRVDLLGWCRSMENTSLLRAVHLKRRWSSAKGSSASPRRLEEGWGEEGEVKGGGERWEGRRRGEGEMRKR